MRIDRRTYADHYGPTVGDRIRLADTDLIVEIENDATNLRDEASSAAAKSSGTAMGQSPGASRDHGSPDLVITNAVIIDASGIHKADVGVRDGRIFAIGKSGNPGVMDGVTPGLEISASTEVLAGEGQHSDCRRDRLTRALHLAEPDPDAFYAGITTLIGGGTGPATGTKATTCTPGAGTSAGCTNRWKRFP